MRRESTRLTIVLVGMLALGSCIQTAKASIYIRVNGDVEGTSQIQRQGSIYTFTGNIIFDTIIIERNNVVLDGAGYTLQGHNDTSSKGIYLSSISGVTIRSINIKDFDYGIYLYDGSTGNTVSGNNMTRNGYGITLRYLSDGNTVSANNIMKNYYGVYVYSADNNRIYHNNFIDNNAPRDVYNFNSYSTYWDNGYPSGGNYWSRYACSDLKSGPNQDQSGSDGIGDRAVTVSNEADVDHYPLVNSFPIPEFSSTLVLTLFMIATLLTTGLWKRMHQKPQRKMVSQIL